MIKIFRRIRQKLIIEGNLKKYLIYSIGEILLVMIGILLALQVNNWNQQRSINRMETEYLESLRGEFTENLQHLETIYKKREKTSGDIARLMELFGNEPKEVSDEALAKLLRSVHDYYSIVFKATTPVLEEIKNSGNLITISDVDLRKQLILWEQIKNPLLGTQNEIFRYRNDFLKIVSELGSMKEMGGGMIDFPATTGLNFKNGNKLLLQNRNAGNILWSIQGELTLFEKVTYPSVITYLEMVIKLIDENLD
jgi:hypothetical protein